MIPPTGRPTGRRLTGGTGKPAFEGLSRHDGHPARTTNAPHSRLGAQLGVLPPLGEIGCVPEPDGMFGRSYRLTRREDALGMPTYALAVR